MKKIIQIILALAVTSTLLAACALQKPESAALYDLGPARQLAGAPVLSAISVAEVSAPSWLDRPQMFYRLNYQNDQQPRVYAHSRWVMSPAQLIAQRVKVRIAQAGGTVLPASDGALNVPMLRIETDDFMQNFDAPEQSVGRVALRVSLFRGRTLVAQKTFRGEAPATSADANGGVRALAAASDVAIIDMMQWLSSLLQK